MTDKPRKMKSPVRPQWVAPITIGHVLGEKIRAANAAKNRRAELDGMGFKAIKVDE